MDFTHDSKVKRMRVFQKHMPAIEAVRKELDAMTIHAARQNRHHKGEAPEWKRVDALRAKERELVDAMHKAVSHWSFNRTI